MKRASSAGLLATAWALKVDRVTAEVVGELERAAIPCILLKGPVFREWLYDDGSLRVYTDTDLLVPPDALPGVVSTLEGLGFTDRSRTGIPDDRPLHAFTFFRPADRAHVDVHTAMHGVTISPDVVWREISADTDTSRVGGREVSVPSRSVLALHVVLHAAQHGVREAKPLEDLRRALERADLETWNHAASLAATFKAMGPFSVGLGLLPEGRRVRDALGLNDVKTDVITRLRATTPPHLSRGFEWLASRPGFKAKAKFVVLKLFPPPAFMRRWSPLARRGFGGLVLSYPWRLLWILWHAPAGFRAWLRARR